MILSKEMTIFVNSATLEHFTSLGYDNLKCGTKLNVPIEHLNSGSNLLVKVKCDICGKEKDLKYRIYLKNIRNQGYYCCSEKCSIIKMKQTNLDRYKNENYNNREKYKKTCLEDYGFENPSQVKEFKDKRKNTMVERHGVEYYTTHKNFWEKYEQTSLENYGTSHPMSSDKMKEIKKEWYIKNGFNVESEEFGMYKRDVYRLTKKIKNKLIESWNGLDYYDGEYIKDNFELPYYDGNYPTIDHKITIFEGFKNNIKSEEISDISNLCFTKRCINSKKTRFNESDFIL